MLDYVRLSIEAFADCQRLAAGRRADLDRTQCQKKMLRISIADEIYDCRRPSDNACDDKCRNEKESQNRFCKLSSSRHT